MTNTRIFVSTEEVNSQLFEMWFPTAKEADEESRETWNRYSPFQRKNAHVWTGYVDLPDDLAKAVLANDWNAVEEWVEAHPGCFNDSGCFNPDLLVEPWMFDSARATF